MVRGFGFHLTRLILHRLYLVSFYGILPYIPECKGGFVYGLRFLH